MNEKTKIDVSLNRFKGKNLLGALNLFRANLIWEGVLNDFDQSNFSSKWLWTRTRQASPSVSKKKAKKLS